MQVKYYFGPSRISAIGFQLFWQNDIKYLYINLAFEHYIYTNTSNYSNL